MTVRLRSFARFVRIAGTLGLLAFAWAIAQEPSAAPEATADVVVPPSLVVVTPDGVAFSAFGTTISYVAGLGWTTGWDLPAPVPTVGGGVRVSADTAELLGLPRIVAVRRGLDGAGVRLVVDFAGLTGGALELERAVSNLRTEAAVGPERPLVWTLPPLALPASASEGVIFAEGEVRLEVSAEADGTRLALASPDARATTFPLSGPDRLVVDLVPLALGSVGGPSDSDAETRDVAPGVRYRRFRSIGAAGPTTVHVVELDPRAVDLRVVGRSGEGRTVAAWADGGVAAINAGYFDPSTFASIGLRRIAGTLLSWPSRGRAAVGFGADGTVVARAGARAQIDVDGLRVADLRLDGDRPLAWSAVPGARVGSPRVGVLVLDGDGIVRSNTVGPRTVPAGGSALAYPADVRPLALVEPGQRVRVDARLLPDALEGAPWAVEAGPLLVAGGLPAFEPESEGFQRGQRILDEPVQQAALGVRSDGTVLMVVAERMVAEDLVSLFLSLGAEAALRLDSGSSATLVAGGRTVNRLLSRPVESAIVAVPSLEAEAPR